MLSGETSVGKWPVETVATMAKIIENTEDHGIDRIAPLGTRPHTHSGAVSLAAVEIAELLGCKYVCVFTESGDSFRRVSRLRSNVPLLAFTPSETNRNRLALSWGAKSFLVSPVKHTDQMMFQVDELLLANDLAKVGEEVVIVAGTPPGIPGSTNSLRVHRVGDAVNGVVPAFQN
jgi:pyruvate kinase